MQGRAGGGVVVVVVLVLGLFALDRFVTPADPCSDSPVLAAGPGVLFADSCIDTISYRGTRYYVDCVPVHESRVGRSFLADGGDTYFGGAAELEGIPRSDAFILEGDYCPKHTSVAISDSFTRLQAGLLKVPTTATNELEEARKRQPWIVPGRREFPDVLDPNAVVDDGVIAITNLNGFVWRNCDQLQINAPDDEWAPWEARPVEHLGAGASASYSAIEFARDSHGLEELSPDAAEDLRGSEVFVMCHAPGGQASGSATLR